MKKAFFNGETRRFSVCVSVEDYRKLKHIAVDKDLSLADLVREVVNKILEESKD